MGVDGFKQKINYLQFTGVLRIKPRIVEYVIINNMTAIQQLQTKVEAKF